MDEAGLLRAAVQVQARMGPFGPIRDALDTCFRRCCASSLVRRGRPELPHPGHGRAGGALREAALVRSGQGQLQRAAAQRVQQVHANVRAAQPGWSFAKARKRDSRGEDTYFVASRGALSTFKKNNTQC